MSFDELHQVIPKLLTLWTSADVTKWLQWLKVRVKLAKFVQAGVDGSVLKLITMDDLENEFEVSSIGTRKKLMEWFNHTLSQYNTYVESKLEDKMMLVEPLIEKNWSTSTSSSVSMENENLDDKIELLIRPFDDDNQSGDHFYKLTKENMIIGRNNNCHMCVRESTVSGSHAKIWKQGNKFFLQDVGSKNGTYIKTRQRQYLQSGDMLEMGEYLFQVTRIDEKSMQMICTRIEFENIPLKIEITQNQSYKIGRNPDNDLFFADDLHLSGRHAKIYLLNGRFVIQDLDSTNGTWRRISKSGTISQPQRLHNKTVIKIGNSNSYVCNLSSNTPSRQVSNDCCLVCKQQKLLDGVILPCRHLVGCSQCVQTITKCPICSISITSCIKIY